MADVQKSAFSLSSATLMMAPAFSVDPFSLRPDLHSVGMSSEINVSVNSSVTELKNGVAQVTVDSKRTGVSASITANVYEMTSQNFYRSQAMSGSPVVMKRLALTAAAASAAVSLTATANGVPGETTSTPTAATDIPAGSTLLIQRANQTDYLFVATTTAAATLATGTFTIPIAASAIPAGMTFAVGDVVWVVDDIPIGSMDADDVFGVKIVGTLSQFNRPVVAVFPKVRVAKGFQLSFNETQYTSMPWELSPLLLSTGEASSLARGSEFGTRAPGVVYVGA